MLVAFRAVIASQKPIGAAGRDIDLMQAPGLGAKRSPAITAEVLEMQHDPPRVIKIASSSATMEKIRRVSHHPCHRAATREQCHRRYRSDPDKETSIFYRANKIGGNICRTSCHRHREHPTAQRAARVSRAADCDRRCTESDQSLGIRPAKRAGHANRICSAIMRSGYVSNNTTQRIGLLFSRHELQFLGRLDRVYQDCAYGTRAWQRCWASTFGESGCSGPGRPSRS